MLVRIIGVLLLSVFVRQRIGRKLHGQEFIANEKVRITSCAYGRGGVRSD